MANLDENPIIQLGTDPIPGGEPCGADIGDDEEYMFVTAEIGKADRIEAEEPDWYAMEQQGLHILGSKSKDVEIASILGQALFKQYGYAGLAAALGLINGLVKNFWEGLVPPRPRRRKARIETLCDRFTDGGWFGENQPKGDRDFDALDRCVERIAELDAALSERMPDDRPDFGKFQRKVKEYAGMRPKPQVAAPPAAPAGEAGAAPAAGAGGFAAGEIGDVSGAVNAVLQAASFLRKKEPPNPLGYVLVRIVKWSKISLPTSDAAKYEIEPPEASTVDALEHQFKNGLWDHLLNGAEAAFRSSDPLWLDLQRYACAAMKGLGPDYEKAHDAVVSATAGLVRRLGDGLFELKFRGGGPLCGGETKMWLDSEVVTADAGGGGGASAEDGRLTEASDKAKKLAASGKLKEALRELQAGLMTCNQRRDQLLWRLRIAQLCFDSQRLQLAAPLLEECYEEINRFGIGEWEPRLAVDVAQTLYRCRKSLVSSEKSPAPESLEKVRDSFTWLCQLDPLAALAAEPSGK
ncbi:MAG TPA: type VI secretion system protein TssA [Phycisphaerae bacterium]|nr:type VI secretion system protein TssA [Phycisphaerae bacterium]